MLTEAKVGVAVSDSRRREQMGEHQTFKNKLPFLETPAKCLSPRPTFWCSILFTRWWSWLLYVHNSRKYLK